MGTRADFYVGRGKDAEWLGSIAWDGYRSVPDEVLLAESEDYYREAVSEFLAARDDATTPEMGWPWPWDDSNTTDVAYAFDGGETWATSACQWYVPAREDPPEYTGSNRLEFPDMSERKATTLGRRSGLLVVST